MELVETGVAAHRLGLSALRVRQLADAGELRMAVRTARGRRLFDPRDVERLREIRSRRSRGDDSTSARK